MHNFSVSDFDVICYSNSNVNIDIEKHGRIKMDVTPYWCVIFKQIFTKFTVV